MARINLLKPRQVETLGVGTYADGGNLFLRIRSKHSRQWIFRYKRQGKVTEISIGPTLDRNITEARDIAAEMRRALRDSVNPVSIVRKASSSGPLTFQDYAERIDKHRRVSLRPGRHVDKFANSLRDYAYPFIGDKRPGEIGFADIESILRQPVTPKGQAIESAFWNSKHETASRVRRRIEVVLDYADRIEGRDRRNPAAWGGGLEHAQLGGGAKSQHLASMPYAAVPQFMIELRSKMSMSALCLRYIILSACRSGEARNATWAEIDLKQRTWTLPAVRTKMGRQWRIPLCEEATVILNQLAPLRNTASSFVFPNMKEKALSDVAVSKTLHALCAGFTVHGFRASFRTWGAEQTAFSNEALERALSHVDSDKVRAAYQRSDLFEERIKLAEAWCTFCNSIAPARDN